MEPIYYPEGEYIVTMPSSNIISHQLNLYGAENVLVGGLVRQFAHSYDLTWPKNSLPCLNECLLDHDSIVRGDLAEIEIGMRCIVGKRAVLRPTSRTFKGGHVFFPLKIGENVFIDDDSIIKCLSIGSNVKIGRNSVISHQCVLSSCCEILPDTILAPGTIVPPFSVYGGQPGRLVDSLPEGFVEAQAMLVKAHYERFQPLQDPSSDAIGDY